jgi:hypothetical protein
MNKRTIGLIITTILPSLIIGVAWYASSLSFYHTNDGVFHSYNNDFNLYGCRVLYRNVTDNELYTGFVVDDPFHSSQYIDWTGSIRNITILDSPDFVISSNIIIGWRTT